MNILTDPSGLGLILFCMGIFPLWFNSIKVEKHYTSFHTAFWNLYAVGVSIIGTAVLTNNSALLYIGAILLVSLFYLFELNPAKQNNFLSDQVRSMGQSSIASSVSLLIFFYGITGNFFVGLISGGMNLFFFTAFDDEIREYFSL